MKIFKHFLNLVAFLFHFYNDFQFKLQFSRWSNVMLYSVMYEMENEGQKRNSAVKIEGGRGQKLYLYIVKIGNFDVILRDISFKYFNLCNLNIALLSTLIYFYFIAPPVLHSFGSDPTPPLHTF